MEMFTSSQFLIPSPWKVQLAPVSALGSLRQTMAALKVARLVLAIGLAICASGIVVNLKP